MSTSRRPCRIALLGCGTVGSAVAARLAGGALPDLRLTHILDRDRSDALRRRAGETICTTRIDDILESDADIVVEALGGVEPARTWIGAALARGKSVVTANKQVIARHGRTLLAQAAARRRQLRFEAAVGCAMPIVAAVRDALCGDAVMRIEAVLNGTATFVLSHMETNGGTLDEAVALAQQRGLAEADPSDDLQGRDAAAKLAILCALAFGADLDVEAIDRETIERVTPDTLASLHRRGRTVRQVALAVYDRERGALRASVGPRELPRRSFLGRTSGAGNAALITCEHAGTIGLFGRGAGDAAAAVAIISDLLAIARERAAPECPDETTPLAEAL